MKLKITILKLQLHELKEGVMVDKKKVSNFFDTLGDLIEFGGEALLHLIPLLYLLMLFAAFVGAVIFMVKYIISLFV